MREIQIRTKKRVLWTSAQATTRGWERLVGIMFRSHLERPLLISFDRQAQQTNAIHSLFCLVPFDAVFLDTQGRVVDIVRSIQPFRLLVTPRRSCSFVLETPQGQSGRLSIGDPLTFVPRKRSG